PPSRAPRCRPASPPASASRRAAAAWSRSRSRVPEGPEGKASSVLARSPGLGWGFALSGPPEGQLYLRPISFIHGAEAAAALEAGAARRLAGGPLAFTRCEVLKRGAKGIECAFVTVFALEEWARKAGSEVEHHVGSL